VRALQQAAWASTQQSCQLCRRQAQDAASAAPPALLTAALLQQPMAALAGRAELLVHCYCFDADLLQMAQIIPRLRSCVSR
jgi:hypothetical protein